MAQDVKIVAPDSIRQVTVTNQGQAVALDVNIVNAAFSASINVSPTMSVTNSAGSPLYVTGNFAATVNPVTFSSSTFVLTQWQGHDVSIPDGANGIAFQLNAQTGTILLGGGLNVGMFNSGSTTVYSPCPEIFTEQDTSFVNTIAGASGSWPYGHTQVSQPGFYTITTAAGFKTLRFENTSVVPATCSIVFSNVGWTGPNRTIATIANGATSAHSTFTWAGGFALAMTVPDYAAGISFWVDDGFSGTLTFELGRDFLGSYSGPGNAVRNWVQTPVYDMDLQDFFWGITGYGAYYSTGSMGRFVTIPNVAGYNTVRLNGGGAAAGNYSASIMWNQAPFVQPRATVQNITGTVHVDNIVSDVKQSGTWTVFASGTLSGSGFVSGTLVNQVVTDAFILDYFSGTGAVGASWVTSGTAGATTTRDGSGLMMYQTGTNSYNVLGSTGSWSMNPAYLTRTFDTLVNFSNYYPYGVDNQETAYIGLFQMLSTSSTLPNDGYFFEFKGAKQLNTWCVSGGLASGSYNFYQITSSLPQGPHQLTVQNDNSTVFFYLDGNLMHSATAIVPAATALPAKYFQRNQIVPGVTSSIRGIYTSVYATRLTSTVVYNSSSLADVSTYGGFMAVLPAVASSQSAAYTQNKIVPLVTDLQGNLKVTLAGAAGGAATVVWSSASLTNSTTTLLGSNNIRVGATVANRSLSYPIYITLGPSASFDRFGVRLPPNGYYEVPYGYTGLITAATSGTNTAVVMVEEVTP